MIRLRRPMTFPFDFTEINLADCYFSAIGQLRDRSVIPKSQKQSRPRLARRSPQQSKARFVVAETSCVILSRSAKPSQQN
jgi:hypothetical protein